MHTRLKINTSKNIIIVNTNIYFHSTWHARTLNAGNVRGWVVNGTVRLIASHAGAVLEKMAACGRYSEKRIIADYSRTISFYQILHDRFL